jgi:hypothetical protein
MHVAVWCDDLDIDKIRSLWVEKYGISDSDYCRLDERSTGGAIRSLTAYLVKYIEKSLCRSFDKPEWFVYNAVLWKTGRRIYSASKGVRSCMKWERESNVTNIWIRTSVVGRGGAKTINQNDEFLSLLYALRGDLRKDMPYIRDDSQSLILAPWHKWAAA